MSSESINLKLIRNLLLRLLPIQILLAAVGSVNGIVSGLFASNYVGVKAMTAVGLYAVVTQLLTAVNLMLLSGSQIICGQYMGRNKRERCVNIFSVDLLIAGAFAAVIILALFATSFFDLTRFAVGDGQVRALFNTYLLGQAVGVLPLMLGQQLAVFLSLENKPRLTTAASLAFIVVNLIFNYLFVVVLDLGAFGLALASSLGLWVFFLVQAFHFASGKGLFRFSLRGCRRADAAEILKIGLPGSLSQGYQTIRRIIVNGLVITFVGSIGLSAFAAVDTLLGIFWAVPNGMLAVSRMMMSISIGEEDRRTLTDVMRVMFVIFLPIMIIIVLAISASAVPLTHLFYHDPSSSVFRMTVWGFRILPLCMPLSMIYMHFVCYGQESGKQLLVHILSALDGVICVAGFSALLVPVIGIRGVYLANILNGVVTTIVIIGYAWLKNRHLPWNMEELMVLPDDFGVPEERRIDLTLEKMQDIVLVSETIQSFCTQQGIDQRRAMLAGLCMEEMAGNVVEHGFTKDRKKHFVDVRVSCKEGDAILLIRDDCVQFDPIDRLNMDSARPSGEEDPARNIGIRMVTGMAKEVAYQTILGLNVLRMRI